MICLVIDTRLITGLVCIDYQTIHYTIPINLVINYLVIDTQNVHPLIDQIVQRTFALRGTTVFNIQTLNIKTAFISGPKNVWSSKHKVVKI